MATERKSRDTERRAGVNRYITKSPDGTEQVYEGFGRGAMPLEVPADNERR